MKFLKVSDRRNIRDDDWSCKELEAIVSTIEFFNRCRKMFGIILGFFLDKPGISWYITFAVTEAILQ